MLTFMRKGENFMHKISLKDIKSDYIHELTPESKLCG